MTTGNDTKSLYQSLPEHYASVEPTLPRRREILQILALRITPKEAELALKMEGASGKGRAELEEGLDMLRGEHWDDDATHGGGTNVPHRASVNDGLGDAPVEESP